MSPIRVDFYLLESDKPEDVWLIACRLLEKAYARGHRIFVHCEHQNDAQYIDELLWTYKDESFIPHNLQGEGPEPPPPIQIGYGPEPRGYNDILLNLASAIPPYFMRFHRIIEIVSADEAAKALSRNHYRDYRAQNCTLHTHSINV